MSSKGCLYQLKRCLFVNVCIISTLLTVHLAIQGFKDAQFLLIYGDIEDGITRKTNFNPKMTRSTLLGVVMGLYAVSIICQLFGLIGAAIEKTLYVWVFTVQSLAWTVFVAFCLSSPNQQMLRLQFAFTLISLVYLNALKKSLKREKREMEDAA